MTKIKKVINYIPIYATSWHKNNIHVKNLKGGEKENGRAEKKQSSGSRYLDHHHPGGAVLYHQAGNAEEGTASSSNTDGRWSNTTSTW
ncbi:MAG TPA: hypothetical protein PK165_04700 [bacterium]|nr:hypothetical protein [bacterium]